MTKQPSKPRQPTPAGRPRRQDDPSSPMPAGLTLAGLGSGQTGSDLLALRAQLHRAEKATRRAPTPPPTRPQRQQPVKPQREAELAGVLTDEFSLHRAHARLRAAVYDGAYHLCPHAIGHARAEGFLEHDILNVLLSGRVRAVYPDDHRWLVCGSFEACGVSLPLHVVAQHDRGGHIDIVTAFVPRHPHHVVSRARLALMLRYDDEQIRTQTAAPTPKAGHRKGRWKKG